MKESIKQRLIELLKSGQIQKFNRYRHWFAKYNINLQGVDLSGINLENVNFRYADLTGAKLEGTNLMGTDLRSANLKNSNLMNAKLNGANLKGAQLEGLNLRSADLSMAILSGVNLKDVDLRCANLKGANIDFACLPFSVDGFDWKIDKHIAAQIAYHFCSMQCDDKEVKETQEAIKILANQFHRIGEDVEKL